jgi:hypothetical protein
MKLLVTLLLATMLAAACASTDDQQDQVARSPAEAVNAGSASPDPIEPEAHPSDGAERREAEDNDLIHDIETDRDLDVEVTVPAGYLEGADQGSTRADAQERGIHDVTFNDDGSVTFKMSRATHQQFMAEVRDEVVSGLAALPDDVPSIEQVGHNRDFTRIALTVDRPAWEGGSDELAALAIAFAVGLYHAFDGTDPDNFQINFAVIDADTNEVFDTIMLSDAAWRG